MNRINCTGISPKFRVDVDKVDGMYEIAAQTAKEDVSLALTTKEFVAFADSIVEAIIESGWDPGELLLQGPTALTPLEEMLVAPIENVLEEGNVVEELHTRYYSEVLSLLKSYAADLGRQKDAAAAEPYGLYATEDKLHKVNEAVAALEREHALWADRDTVIVYNSACPKMSNLIVEELHSCYYAGDVSSVRVPLADDVLAAIVGGRQESERTDPDLTILLNADILAHYPDAIWVILDDTYPVSEDVQAADYNVEEILSLICLEAILLGHADPSEPFLVDAGWLTSHAARQTLIAVASEIDSLRMDSLSVEAAAETVIVAAAD